MKAISSKEMQALEINAEYYGISRLQMMENAGKSIADEIASRFKPEKTKVAIFCGLGGNGGDGFVAARHLLTKGFDVTLIIAGKTTQIKHEAALKNWKAIENLRNKIKIYEVYDSSLIPEIKAEVIVDALLGIGIKGAPKPPIAQLIEKINRMKAFKIAVDIPSGLNSDTGKPEKPTFKADITLTFYKRKIGLETPEAKKYAGKVIVKDIGLPHELENYAGPGDVKLVIKPRPATAHKGDFGKLLIVGGSETYSGAPALAALAALKTGVDLTYIAAPEKTASIISAFSPNLITIKLKGMFLKPENLSTLKEIVKQVTAVIIGPGLGLHEETKRAVLMLIEAVEKAGKPLLLDADGLKAFAENGRKLKTRAVLTPHAGEFRMLSGQTLPEQLDERAKEVQKIAKKFGATVLLKSHVDVIANSERVKFNFTGNPGMTVGGTGDVLSGIVGAFLAQENEPFEAAVAGAFVNGACGDLAVKEKGYHITATDLLEWIPRVIDDPMIHVKVRDFAK